MGLLLSGLSTFFMWLMDYTIDISILICLIFIIKSIASRKLPAWWHYSLWIVLLLRMLLPWQIETPLTITNVVPITIDESLFESVLIEEEIVTAGPAPELSAAEAGWNIQVNDVLLALWMSGALFLGCYILVKNIKFRKLIKNEPLLTEKSVLNLLEKCKRRMKVHNNLEVTVTDKIKSPALYGYIRPRLLLPAGIAETLDSSKLSYIFLHELGHLKRHDIGVSWVISFLQVVQWFNPFVWMAFHQMRLDQESACDAFVLSRIKGDQTVAYASTIVGFLESIYRNRKLPALVGILESRTQLKKRITMIVNFRKNSKIMMLLSNALLIVIAVAFFSFTGSAKPDYEITAPDSVILQALPVDVSDISEPEAGGLKLNIKKLNLADGYKKILASGQKRLGSVELSVEKPQRDRQESMALNSIGNDNRSVLRKPAVQTGKASIAVQSGVRDIVSENTGALQTVNHVVSEEESSNINKSSSIILAEDSRSAVKTSIPVIEPRKALTEALPEKAEKVMGATAAKNDSQKTDAVSSGFYIDSNSENADILRYYKYIKTRNRNNTADVSLSAADGSSALDNSVVKYQEAANTDTIVKSDSSEKAGDENRVYKKRETDETPKIVTFYPPIYPFQARARGIEGSVILKFTVDKNGSVVKPQVVKATPEGVFEQAALDTVVKYKFKPAMKDGKPVSSVARLPISFSVDESNRFLKFAQR